jgi:hypothetical protein
MNRVSTFGLAALAALALALPAAAQQNAQPDTNTGQAPTTDAQSGRDIMLTGKLVDLHQYMTMPSASDTTSLLDRARQGTDAQPDRPGRRPGANDAADRTPPGRAADQANRDRPAAARTRILALETATGLVILGQDRPERPSSPVLSPTPQPRTQRDPADPGDAAARRDPADRGDAAPRRDQDQPQILGTPRTDWQGAAADHLIGQRVSVSGQVYSRGGVRYLVASKVSPAPSPTDEAIKSSTDAPAPPKNR